MKSLIAFLLSKKITAKIFLNFFLKLDNQLYKAISTLSIAAEEGEHPKHDILKYHEWFLSRVDERSVVLDIGCNTGNLLTKIGHKINAGYGIDIKSDYIKIAKRKNKLKNLDFI